jgi:hypothetical protein
LGGERRQQQDERLDQPDHEVVHEDPHRQLMQG